MKMMIRRMGRNMLLLVLLVTVIASLLCSCGYETNVKTSAETNSYSLSGQVTSEGSGLAGVTITLSGASQSTVISDATGNFTFIGLANGNYTLTPVLSGFIFTPSSRAQMISNANIIDINFSAVTATSVQLVVCPASGTTNVTIQDFLFTPAAITVAVNSIVKWTNIASSLHTVTSGTSPNLDDKFNSGSMGFGETVCYQFLATGTYPYFCTFHQFMTGSVVVQ